MFRRWLHIVIQWTKVRIRYHAYLRRGDGGKLAPLAYWRKDNVLVPLHADTKKLEALCAETWALNHPKEAGREQSL